LPVLVGGKIYNTLQTVMTAKVVIVLGFCLGVGICFVSPQHWGDIFSGFLKFGSVPTATPDGQEQLVNLVSYRLSEGEWPVIALANIAVLGAFAGYAGGGGLANSTYSNYVRDKGWGMGSKVGAIASAFGGHQISLSHVGQVFPLNEQSRRRWSDWWRYLLTDQLIVWAPGCFMGMALPALISLEFAPHSPLYHEPKKMDWAQAIISADGLRHAPEFSPLLQQLLWLLTLFVGLMVLLPSQMSIVEDISRRWTDILWTSNLPWFAKLEQHRVKHVYYSIFFLYLGWSFACLWIFSRYGNPKLMTLIIANMNNLAIGWTAFHLLWVNSTLLPRTLQPRWYHRLGLLGCGVFYLGLAFLVFAT
jgi:hypothetical protein